MQSLKQQGVALISALVVVSIVVSVTVWLVYRQQIDIRQTANVQHLEQAYQYADAIEAWAKAVLARDFQDNNDVDSLDEDWATILPSISIPGGQLKGKLEDLQSKFNLNNLVDVDGKPIPRQQDIFSALLARLSLPKKLLPVVTDWIDKGSDVSNNGEEMDYYLTLENPYLTADAEMVSESEIRLLQGIDDEKYKVLIPHVATIKNNGKLTNINVNTATSEVLVALGLSDDQASNLIDDRKDRAFQTLDDFRKDPEVKKIITDTEGLSVKTNWFLLQADVNIDRTRVHLNSIIFRDDNGSIRVVQRRYGR